MKNITILFDLDGTLINSTNAIVGCFYHSFKELNFNFPGNTEDIKNEIGYPLEIMYENLGVKKDNVWEFVTSYKKEYRKISLEQTSLLPNAIQSIKLAYSFAKLAIVTTKTTAYTLPLLEHLDIMKYFETMIGRQEVINPKPHPEPVLKCLEIMQIKPSKDVYIIGDTKLDLIAGNEAGINTVGVLCGYGHKNDLEQYSNLICNDSLEAVKLIHNIHF